MASDRSKQEQATAAYIAVVQYAPLLGYDDPKEFRTSEQLEELLVDLVTDLWAYAEDKGVDFLQVLDTSMMHHAAEAGSNASPNVSRHPALDDLMAMARSTGVEKGRWVVVDMESASSPGERYDVLGEFATHDQAANFIDQQPDKDKIERGGYGIDAPSEEY